MERVELHFHLLPAVDDGPPDVPTALDLAREAVADGTRLVAVTPHARDMNVAEIPERVRELRAALAAARIDLDVRPGVELAWNDVARVDEALLAQLAHGPAERRWVLLEAPLPGTGELADFEAAAGELRDRGYGLLVGHPERSPALMTAPGSIDRLIAAGDRMQLNASSLTGYHGAVPKVCGIDLAKSGRASVVASDAHRPVTRGPALGEAVAVLRGNGVSAGAAERMVSAAPRALVDHGMAIEGRLAA